jgi:hypothetical protein
MESVESPRDEQIRTFHAFLSDKNYRNFIPVVLIIAWAFFFHLLFLIIDAFIDKEKHKRLAKEQHDHIWNKRMVEEAAKLKKSGKVLTEAKEAELAKRNAADYARELEFCTWSHRNLQISFSHSLLCSLWLAKILICSQDMYVDLMTYVSWETYIFITFSSGYFLYDFYDIYSTGYARTSWIVCLHHWIVIFSFTYHLTNIMHLAHTVISLIMEFNSVFLHLRKLLKFYKWGKESRLVRVNSVVTVITFTTCRFGVLIAIYNGLYRDYNKLYKLYGKTYCRVYVAILVQLTNTMTVINCVLYKRILEADVFTKKNMKRWMTGSPTTTTTVLNSNNAVDEQRRQHVDLKRD